MSETNTRAAELLGGAVAEVTKLAVEPALAPFQDELAKVRTAMSRTLKVLEDKVVELDDAAKDSSDALTRFGAALEHIDEARSRWDEQSDLLGRELARTSEQLPLLSSSITGVMQDQHRLGAVTTHIADNQRAMTLQLARLRALVLGGLVVLAVLCTAVAVLVIAVAR